MLIPLDNSLISYVGPLQFNCKDSAVFSILDFRNEVHSSCTTAVLYYYTYDIIVLISFTTRRYGDAWH